MAKTQIDVVEINAQTNQRIERAYTAEEIAQIELDKEISAALKNEEAAKLAAKAAVLEKLGLTEAELKAVLG